MHNELFIFFFRRNRQLLHSLLSLILQEARKSKTVNKAVCLCLPFLMSSVVLQVLSRTASDNTALLHDLGANDVDEKKIPSVQ